MTLSRCQIRLDATIGSHSFAPRRITTPCIAVIAPPALALLRRQRAPAGLAHSRFRHFRHGPSPNYVVARWYHVIVKRGSADTAKTSRPSPRGRRYRDVMSARARPRERANGANEPAPARNCAGEPAGWHHWHAGPARWTGVLGVRPSAARRPAPDRAGCMRLIASPAATTPDRWCATGRRPAAGSAP
jgi:hypothetical protein